MNRSPLKGIDEGQPAIHPPYIRDRKRGRPAPPDRYPTSRHKRSSSVSLRNKSRALPFFTATTAARGT